MHPTGLKRIREEIYPEEQTKRLRGEGDNPRYQDGPLLDESPFSTFQTYTDELTKFYAATKRDNTFGYSCSMQVLAVCQAIFNPEKSITKASLIVRELENNIDTRPINTPEDLIELNCIRKILSVAQRTLLMEMHKDQRRLEEARAQLHQSLYKQTV